MVTIRNILMRDTLISADCYAEGETYFKLVIDVKTCELIVNTLGRNNMYSSQAYCKLLSLKDNLPTETVVMWC